MGDSGQSGWPDHGNLLQIYFLGENIFVGCRPLLRGLGPGGEIEKAPRPFAAPDSKRGVYPGGEYDESHRGV